MQKNLTTIKKIIFGFLMFYMICGLLYFFVLSWSPFDFVAEILYKIDLNRYFYNHETILVLAIFAPEAFVIAAIVWIFYRKETSVLLRGIITAVPVWQLISFYGATYINSYYTSKTLKFLVILPIAGFIAIFYFLFRELIFKSKNIHQEG